MSGKHEMRTSNLDPASIELTRRAIKVMVDGHVSFSDALDIVGQSANQAHEHIIRLPDVQSDYDRARANRADHWVEETITLADSDDDPGKVRNQIQARQWAAARYRPSVYGDKVEIQATHTISIVDALAVARSRVKQLPPIDEDIIDGDVIIGD